MSCKGFPLLRHFFAFFEVVNIFFLSGNLCVIGAQCCENAVSRVPKIKNIISKKLADMLNLL